ncbi:MAG: radical SAM protein [Candidatus Bathyarchaeia archaeon]
MSATISRIIQLLDADENTLRKMTKTAKEVSLKNFGKKICFYAPSFMYYKTDYFCSSPTLFPSISITGKSCALKCKHCDGIVLRTMYPASTPKELVSLCKTLKQQGAKGCLISGGCMPNGSVPIDNFIEALAQVKKETDLTIAVHTGIIKPSTAQRLAEAKVDSALIDIIGSEETIKEVYRLNVKIEDYEKSLEALHEAGIPLVPHVLVGLHFGKLKGEFKALEMISKYKPAAVIIIAFMPIKGTPMETVAPPKPEEIAKVLVAARLMMPNTPVVLGCMRPKGTHRVKTDMLAIESGVNAIAFPTVEAVKLAEALGYEVSFSSLCCSQAYEKY